MLLISFALFHFFWDETNIAMTQIEYNQHVLLFVALCPTHANLESLYFPLSLLSGLSISIFSSISLLRLMVTYSACSTFQSYRGVLGIC